MKKSLVALLLLIAMVVNVFALTGCDIGSIIDGLLQDADKTQKTVVADYVIPDGGYDGSEVTITFYHTMGSNLTEVLDGYIEEFNKLYPKITIEHEQVGGYDDVRDQIKTELTVGAQPNIAYCYPDHVALYNITGNVVNLNSLINSSLTVTRADGTTETLGYTQAQINDFIEGYYNEGKQFGHVNEDGEDVMYTLPLSKSTEVLYYNKTFFDENGLTVPTTWDELYNLCKQIKTIDPTSIPLGYDSEANWFITMCEQYGSDYTSATGDHFLFDNETNRAFVEEFNKWYQEGLVTTQNIYGAYTSGLFTTTASSDTKSYMSIGSSAGATHQRPTPVDGKYPFEVGIASIPQVNASNPKVISQGPSLCIFQGGDITDQEILASWLFVKYLTTCVEFQADFSIASGYVPVIKSVEDDATYADFLANANGGTNVAALSAKVCLAQESAYYTSPAFNGSSDARDQVAIILQKALVLQTKGDTLKSDIQKLFKDAVSECEYNQ